MGGAIETLQSRTLKSIYVEVNDDFEDQNQDLKVITPIKKKRGQDKLAPNDKEYSKAVSKMRQPIESLFSWINRMTQIEDASLVRSAAGLITHIFGKLAAAMFSRYKTVPDF